MSMIIYPCPLKKSHLVNNTVIKITCFTVNILELLKSIAFDCHFCPIKERISFIIFSWTYLTLLL